MQSVHKNNKLNIIIYKLLFCCRESLSFNTYFMQAYERRFPTSPLIPVFVGSEVTADTTTNDGSIRTTERRCKLVVEAPYLLKKVCRT